MSSSSKPGVLSSIFNIFKKDHVQVDNRTSTGFTVSCYVKMNIYNVCNELFFYICFSKLFSNLYFYS